MYFPLLFNILELYCIMYCNSYCFFEISYEKFALFLWIIFATILVTIEYKLLSMQRKRLEFKVYKMLKMEQTSLLLKKVW